MIFRENIKKLLRTAGFDVIRYNHLSHPVARRMRLMSSHTINLIFDVGANTGQYGKEIRDLGYTGRIVSFEPLIAAYKKLEKRAAQDTHWDAVNSALGNYNGKSDINVSANSTSSSILDILPAHVNQWPSSAYVAKEEITVCRLDSIIHEHWRPGDRLYLKIDTQGYEKNVIEGAEGAFGKITGIQMEVSLVPLYKDETLLAEMINLLLDNGYSLMSLELGACDRQTGQLLQVDCIFYRA